jgi:hypothetical protein
MQKDEEDMEENMEEEKGADSKVLNGEEGEMFR